ncbi:hypothetical protein CBW65_04195 [Tumebacillus avium]|uniref:YtkA-like domain-containing protein n=1 Tax=Tumebacillus avium TaxID=1903704 RepID=A0A1Y0IIM5_9BACL|nr:hypothetical protein [Tumebacillus avium]ARU60352.1 hypothetical protein CBW65_04195 [Tumebacillus avium]
MERKYRVRIWSVGALLVCLLVFVGTACSNDSEKNVPPSPPEAFLLQAEIQNRDTIKIALQLRKPTEKEIDLKATLSSDQVDPIEEKHLFHGRMDPMQTLNFTYPLKDLPTGKYRLHVQAVSAVSDAETWGGDLDYYFQVKDHQVKVGW